MKLKLFTWKRVLLIILTSILLITLVFDKPIQAGANLPQVRIGLLRTQTSAILAVSEGSYALRNANTGDLIAPELQPLQVGDSIRVEFNASKLISVSIKKGTGDWGSPVGAFSGPIELKPSSANSLNLIGVNNKRYRQTFLAVINSTQTGFNIVNELPVEEYLYGVVPAEMSASWPIEALKAQAVASRTFAATRISKPNVEGYHLLPDQNDQAYGGYNVEDQRSNLAVEATIGKLIVDANNNIISEALYHSNSGGHTEDSENIWTAPVSYLRGKPDPYSMGYGLSRWSYQTDMDTIKAKMGASASNIVGISLNKYASGRVNNVIFKESSGNTITTTGKEFGNLFNPYFYTNRDDKSFMSRFFDFKTNATINILGADGKVTKLHGGGSGLKAVNGSGQVVALGGTSSSYVIQGSSTQKTVNKSPSGAVTIEGNGWGHGAGMSQWGAYGMAQQGFAYDQILKFYYAGVNIR